MLEELADLFEHSAAHGTLIRKVAGKDPVESADQRHRSCHGRRTVTKQRRDIPMTTNQAEGPAIHVQDLEKSSKTPRVTTRSTFSVAVSGQTRIVAL